MQSADGDGAGIDASGGCGDAGDQGWKLVRTHAILRRIDGRARRFPNKMGTGIELVELQRMRQFAPTLTQQDGLAARNPVITEAKRRIAMTTDSYITTSAVCWYDGIVLHGDACHPMNTFATGRHSRTRPAVWERRSVRTFAGRLAADFALCYKVFTPPTRPHKSVPLSAGACFSIWLVTSPTGEPGYWHVLQRFRSGNRMAR